MRLRAGHNLSHFLKDCLPHLFHGFRNKCLNKISLYNMQYFLNNCTSFEKMHGFSINMKNNLQTKMQITLFLMARKNIDFDHVCHVIMYR